MSHPADIYAGKMVRSARKAACLSQEQLGIEVGVSFQQIQKYEIGKNRISASRLWDIAATLGVTDMNYFFEGGEDCYSGRDPENPEKMMIRAEVFQKIQGKGTKAAISRFVKDLAAI